MLLPRQRGTLDLGLHQMEHPVPKTSSAEIAIIDIDIGENSFHVVGNDGNGSIILRQKWRAVRSKTASPTCCLASDDAGGSLRDQVMLSLGYGCGLRAGEIVRLEAVVAGQSKGIIDLGQNGCNAWGS